MCVCVLAPCAMNSSLHCNIRKYSTYKVVKVCLVLAQVTTQTNGMRKGSPSFAYSPVQTHFTPPCKAVTPSRLRVSEVHQASTPATASLNANRAGLRTLTPHIQLQSLFPTPRDMSISSGSPSCGGGGTANTVRVSKESSATRRASVKATLAERPPWSIAAPHSPAISASGSSPSSMARSPRGSPLAVISPVVRACTQTVRKAVAQPSCVGTGVVTRAQTRAKTSATAGSSSATAARPGRHAAPVMAGSVAHPQVAEASSVAAKHGPKPAAQADPRRSASSRTDRQTATRRQPAAATTTTGSKAGASGRKSGKQACPHKNTDAASCPADAPVARKSKGRLALKAEMPTRVQPRRAAKQGWRF